MYEKVYELAEHYLKDLGRLGFNDLNEEYRGSATLYYVSLIVIIIIIICHPIVSIKQHCCCFPNWSRKPHIDSFVV